MSLASETLWTDEGKQALDYLVGERSLKEDVLKRFQIGYVPLRVDHRCRGRMIFPIYDAFDSLIAISTRHLHKKKGDANYFWHESFEKSFYLYGLNLAKKRIFQTKKAILVEGELDVLSLHSHGADLAIGVCGSSFSSFQAFTLLRYCTELYLAFDGDKAGKESVKRVMDLDKTYNISGLDKTTDRGMKIFNCQLPQGSDPDDYIKQHGAKSFVQLMKKAREEILI